MPEHHEITGPVRGAPRQADCVGACVRVSLDTAPTPRWSQALTVHLASGLTGHPAVGHMRLDHLVQGADIVLEGVEGREAQLLGPVLRGAVEAANRACGEDPRPRRLNMELARAEEVASAVQAGLA
jgi:hypothetical protein